MKLPNWPYRMKIDLACAYVGMNRTSFREAINAGQFPKGTKTIGGVYWLRKELEECLDRNSVAFEFNEKI